MKLLPLFVAAAALLTFATVSASAGVCSQNTCSTRLMGVVTSGGARGGQPVQNATVKIYQATEGVPFLLTETVTNARGQLMARRLRASYCRCRWRRVCFVIWLPPTAARFHRCCAARPMPIRPMRSD